jgi:hypothetical protein
MESSLLPCFLAPNPSTHSKYFCVAAENDDTTRTRVSAAIAVDEDDDNATATVADNVGNDDERRRR